jgi:hypothetical protein
VVLPTVLLARAPCQCADSRSRPFPPCPRRPSARSDFSPHPLSPAGQQRVRAVCPVLCDSSASTIPPQQLVLFFYQVCCAKLFHLSSSTSCGALGNHAPLRGQAHTSPLYFQRVVSLSFVGFMRTCMISILSSKRCMVLQCTAGCFQIPIRKMRQSQSLQVCTSSCALAHRELADGQLVPTTTADRSAAHTPCDTSAADQQLHESPRARCPSAVPRSACDLRAPGRRRETCRESAAAEWPLAPRLSRVNGTNFQPCLLHSASYVSCLRFSACAAAAGV